MNLQIPFRRQHTTYNCGPASLQMVFAYFSLLESQADLAHNARTCEKSGTHNSGLIKAATSADFFCYVNNQSTIHEVRHFIHRGLPVIVNYLEPHSDDGHYAVVSGFTHRDIILADPWNGQNFKLPTPNFLDRWYDQDKHHKNWIMVLSKEDLQLGKQFLPKSAHN